MIHYLKPLKLAACIGLSAFAIDSDMLRLFASTNNSATTSIVELEKRLVFFSKPALLRAFEDIHANAPDRFANAAAIRQRIAALPDDLQPLFKAGDPRAIETLSAAAELQRTILLTNPLLDFDLVVARETNNPGLTHNFAGNSQLRRDGYNNRIMQFSIHGNTPERTIYRPEKTRFVGDFCLHWDADRMLFSMPTDKDWQVFEIQLDGTGLRQISPEIENGIHNYDAAYLPNGDFIYHSTLPQVSVPCVNGNIQVENLVRLHADGSVRQLGFDQVNTWHPRVLPNGTVLYQRWEYADIPHSNTRLLMTMNPDGTNQRALYGSNSYWPTAFFYATPIPGSSTRVAGISGGHHGPGRLGELIILDAAKGSHETSGVVQPIPSTATQNIGRIYDNMVDVWPRFLQPQPLSDKYFLVACQPSPKHNWGVYLVDVFDNFLLLKDHPDLAVIEPMPVVRRPVPPVIPDRVDTSRQDATLYIADIYAGPGLRGIPRGTVKSIRAFEFSYSYHGVGGLLGVIGLDGPWDLRRPLGTAKVHADGSAMFEIPANTPISIQPLDADGQALAIMRSWLTAMPGEMLSCVGCHEDRNMAPPVNPHTIASTSPRSPLEPLRPYVAGLSFEQEIQPILNRNCIACHDGSAAKPDLRKGDMINYNTRYGGAPGGTASQGYINLFPFTRSHGIESDYHVLSPMEFHFSTSELGQILTKGHHGVELDSAEYQALVQWSDLNRPYHGSWSSVGFNASDAREARRARLREKYAGVSVNHEELPPPPAPVESIMPPPLPPINNPVFELSAWPFNASASPAASLEIDGYTIPMMNIPAGEFVMGNPDGHRDEQPVARVVIDKPFQMSTYEVTNELYRKFNPAHDSKVADNLSYQFGQRLWSLNEPHQPVVRVSFREALAFCQWLSGKTGKNVTLPSEAQWEWAARAGTATPVPFTDYGKHANTADVQMQRFYADTSYKGYHDVLIKPNEPTVYEMYFLHDPSVDDGEQLSAQPGTYPANAFGLHDMHGNVAEWTRSRYLPYPYTDADGRNDDSIRGKRVARGGSWWHRPIHVTSSHRLVYDDYQPVMWVGFRIIIEE